MSTPENPNNAAMLQHMATINRLNLKAFRANERQSLIFIILNDSIQAVRYDRAALWDMEGKKPKILGVSGQTEANKDARLTKEWQALISSIKDKKKPQLITEASLTGNEKTWLDYHKSIPNITPLWLPILNDDELVLGLWLEIFGTLQNPQSIDDSLQFLSKYLTPAYGSSWRKLKPKFTLKEKGIGKKQISLGLLALFLSALIIRVPLRVVAPCEVLANTPFLVTAPLQGIIEEIKVEPGQAVVKDDILVEYDKRVPLRNLRVAQKEVEILQAEENRARTLGLEDKKSLTELGILSLKLEKEKVNLSLAKWQASQLTLKAPIDGIVMLDNPDNWRGKPVQVGEKILSINNPQNTKIRIWIPEDDNVILDMDKPIKIFLNIRPEESIEAKLVYIANESTLSDQYLPSFVAEANWIEQPKDINIGLKGTSILYGERVSLLYYLMRKPWAKIRNFIGF